MNKTVLMNFQVDKENNLIKVERSFNAPNELVWAAWTEAEILDQWWAPKPYRSVTKSMNFKEGGQWHYYMLSPEGEKQWCLFDFKEIKPLLYFSGADAFCDENAVRDKTKPRVSWENSFTAIGDSTFVNIELQFESLEDLEALVDMGFREGFTAGLENLDHYIASQFFLRKQNKQSTLARVSTYVNFPGNTEEAFNFYRSVFKTEFINGIKRFGELPPSPDQPPLSETLQRMVLHVELPLFGGHVLMGTDAPKEMGFALRTGNTMHIHLEPESRAEADRIFNELSQGGKIEMPLQDMFWGAYYGSFTDKYGINWMINYQPIQ